jgi:hypothetical protein
MNVISQALGKRLASFLSRAQSSYTRLDAVSLVDVAGVLRTGDIVLVEGNSRISTAIKYLTQSSWSHACLYIGTGGESAAAETLLEANLNEGVRLVSLQDYAGFNLRICRPINIEQGDVVKLVSFASSKLGHHYDLKNVFDLIRYLIQKPVVPNRYRRSMISLGSGEPTKAICSTLIAEAFQSIDYPILPRRGDPEFDSEGRRGEVPQFYKRHFTHFTPRDFDLSPYFSVVKPTIERGFDYREVSWSEPG